MAYFCIAERPIFGLTVRISWVIMCKPSVIPQQLSPTTKLTQSTPLCENHQDVSIRDPTRPTGDPAADCAQRTALFIGAYRARRSPGPGRTQPQYHRRTGGKDPGAAGVEPTPLCPIWPVDRQNCPGRGSGQLYQEQPARGHHDRRAHPQHAAVGGGGLSAHPDRGDSHRRVQRPLSIFPL